MKVKLLLISFLFATVGIFAQSGDNESKSKSCGLAAVKLNGKWGYVDAIGKMVIEPQFDSAYAFKSKGITVVLSNGKYGCIDTSGRFVVQPRFDGVKFIPNRSLENSPYIMFK